MKALGVAGRQFVPVDGDKLRRLRRKGGLSVRELAEGAGVSVWTIGRRERGGAEARPQTVRRHANFFDVEQAGLLPTKREELSRPTSLPTN